MKNALPDRIDSRYSFGSQEELRRGATWVYHVSLRTDRPGYAARIADRFELGRDYVEYAAVRSIIKQLDKGDDHHARVVAHVHGITKEHMRAHFPDRHDAIAFVGETDKNIRELGELAKVLRAGEA